MFVRDNAALPRFASVAVTFIYPPSTLSTILDIITMLNTVFLHYIAVHYCSALLPEDRFATGTGDPTYAIRTVL